MPEKCNWKCKIITRSDHFGRQIADKFMLLSDIKHSILVQQNVPRQTVLIQNIYNVIYIYIYIYYIRIVQLHFFFLVMWCTNNSYYLLSAVLLKVCSFQTLLYVWNGKKNTEYVVMLRNWSSFPWGIIFGFLNFKLHS